MRNKIILLVVIVLNQLLYSSDINTRRILNQDDYNSYSVLNSSHSISPSYQTFYSAKSNVDLYRAIFDIGPMMNEDFSIDDIAAVIFDRLDDSSYNTRIQFRQFLYDSLKSIKYNQNIELILLGQMILETTQDEIESRRNEFGLGNDPELDLEAEQLYGELEEISSDVTIHPAIRSKALHYLGSEYSATRADILKDALFDTSLAVINGASRGLNTYFTFMEENQKTAFTDDLIEAIDLHKNNIALRAGRTGSSPTDYFSELNHLKPLLNALGMIKNTDAQSYLINLMQTTDDRELFKQLTYSLSYQPTKECMAILISNYRNIKADTIQTEMASVLTGIIKENEGKLTELKNDPAPLMQRRYLTAVRISRTRPDSAEIDRIKGLLNSSDRDVRMETVKALHILLSFSEQQQLFTTHKQTESDGEIKWLIEQYIGL